MVDTGAQLSVIPIRVLYQLGLKKRDVIPVKMKAKGANNKNLGLMGGFFLRLGGRLDDGSTISTSELVYVFKEVMKSLLS